MLHWRIGLGVPLMAGLLLGCGGRAASDSAHGVDVDSLPDVAEAPRWLVVYDASELVLVRFDDPKHPERLVLQDGLERRPEVAWSASGTRLAWRVPDSEGTHITTYDLTNPGESKQFAIGQNANPLSFGWFGEQEVLVHGEVAGEPLNAVWDPSTSATRQFQSGHYPRQASVGFVARPNANDPFSYYRLGSDPVELPPSDEVELAADGGQVVLISTDPDPPLEAPTGQAAVRALTIDTSAAHAAPGGMIPGSPPAPDPLPGAPFIQWSASGAWIGVEVDWGGVVVARSVLSLSDQQPVTAGFDDLLQVSSSSSFAAPSWSFVGDELLLWASFHPESEAEGAPLVWGLHAKLLSAEPALSFDPERYLEGRGVVNDLVPAGDGHAYVVAYDYTTETSSLVGIVWRFAEAPPQHVQTLLDDFAYDRGEQWLHARPGGASLLLSADPDYDPSQASVSWEPDAKLGAPHGHRLWVVNDDGFELARTGSGLAQWAPDGEGLLVTRDDFIYYVPHDEPSLEYPVAAMSAGFDRGPSVPAHWGE